MSVSNGQLANQTTFNNAFISKTSASTGVAVVALANTDTPSGSAVLSLQREFNAIQSFVGGDLNQSATYKPTWDSDVIGSANDDIKTRVDQIQSVVEQNQSDVADLNTERVRWTKYTKTFADFSSAASSVEDSLFTLDAQGVVQGVVIKHTEAFEGGTLSGVEISVGPSGDVTRYLDGFDAFQSVASSAFRNVQLLEIEDFASTSTVAVRAVSTGDTLDNAISGAFDIWVLTSALPTT